MRTTLWSGLLQALQYNQNRQQSRIRLFETGLRFIRRDNQTIQEPALAGLIAGPALPEQWGLPQREVDFFDAKADLEALMGLAGEGREISFVAARYPALHPGQTARIERGGQVAGLLGALHPRLLDELDISGPVYLFELNLSVIEAGFLPQFVPLSRFPAIRRDIAIIVNEGISAEAVKNCIGQAASDVLKNLQLFDVYRGEHIDCGKKSMALGLTLQASSRTLTDVEVDALMGTIIGKLKEQLDADLRG